MVAFDNDLRYLLAEGTGLADAGLSAAALVGRTIFEAWDPDTAAAIEPQYRAALAGKEIIVDVPYNGRVYRTHGLPLRDDSGTVIAGMVVTQDVTEMRAVHALSEGQARVLEQIVRETPLSDVLDGIARLVEEHTEALCSILLLEDGVRLRHGAGPSLPEDYNRAIDGVEIGDGVGSCGTAAFRRQSVYVADIATDPLWRDYAELALGHNLRACWSTPVLDATGAVLATYALYYRVPREPSPHDLEMIETCAHLTAVAIIRDQARSALRGSERRRAQVVAAMLRADEESRAQVAQDLHDDTIQVLAATLIALDRLTRALDHDHAPEATRTVAALARDTLALAVERTRKLVFDLRPPLLEASGLAPAVTALAESAGADAGFSAHVRATLPRRYPETFEALVYRTCAEAIQNVRKHSRASHLRVDLSERSGAVVAELEDDGCGFRVDRALARGRTSLSFGLDSMIERVLLAE